MSDNNKAALKIFLLIFLLLLAIVICWDQFVFGKMVNGKAIQSDTGVWDLRELLKEYDRCRIVGQVEYIPNALLTPAEFAARENEAVTGYPELVSQYATSRIRLLVPDETYYSIYARGIDFATRLYVNGVLAQEIGKPGETKAKNVPNTGSVLLTVKAEGGVIEIIQQGSNFVHREGGGHTGITIGTPGLGAFLARNYQESIMLGTFLALIFVHIFLFILLRSFRGNLYFALFCLMWFLRGGVTGVRIFSDIFPWLSWEIKFRIEYLAFPVTAFLCISLLNVLFPRILNKCFCYAMYAVSVLFAVTFLFADSLFLSYALLFCEALYATAIIYITVLFIMKLRRLDIEHGVFLAGAALFLLAAINDMLAANNFYDLLPSSFNVIFLYNMTPIAMLLFTYCQAAAVFIVTVRTMKAAAAENAVLKEKTLMVEQQLAKQRLHYSEIMKLVNRQINIPYERIFCENKVVNAVAVYYLGLAESEGITIDIKLDIPEDTGRVPAMDLSIILGNLLENALDYTRRITHEKKYICLNSCIKENYLDIEVINSFDPAVPGGDLGLSPVKAICKKHRGDLEHEVEGNLWKVTATVHVSSDPLQAQIGTEPVSVEAIFRQYKLSRREIEVAVLLLAEGLGAEEIGERLYVSVHTAKYHIANIYRKFDVNKRSEFMALFVKR